MSAAVRSRRRRHLPPIEAELRLEDWAPRGRVRATLDGKMVLVDRGLPGETVQASVQRRAVPWTAMSDTVITAAPDRVDPPCPYYLQGCGGCQLQHVTYPAQVELKRQSVERELASAGIQRPLDAISVPEEPWRYRSSAAIALGWEAGFRPRGRRGILPVRDCLIAHPLIGSLSAALNDLLRAGALPNWRSKAWIECKVVEVSSKPAVQVLIQHIEGLTLETHPELAGAARTIAAIDIVASVAYRHRSGAAVPLAGEPCAEIRVAGEAMLVPAGSFFQTNLAMLDRLISRMRARIGNLQPTSGRLGTIADVYGGAGTFAFAMAQSCDRMVLLELDAAAVAAAAQTAARRGPTNLQVIAGHAETHLRSLPELDLAIVDPPRSGLGETVVAALAERRVPVIFYVSCAPASLARDLAALRARGYRLDWIEIFDFYPQTYHVESLAVLVACA